MKGSSMCQDLVPEGLEPQRVCVVTDSTADIPASLAEELGIVVVPCYVHFGQETYLDGVTLSREQFYTRLASGEQPPTTSPPPVGSFAATYQRLAEHTQQIISIHPAANLSALYNAARVAAEMISNARIALIDSTQASMGTGWLAVLAARAARAGQSLDQIVALMRDTIPRLFVLAVIHDLRYLQRSGRVRWVDALVGSLLSIKPLVMLKNGQVSLLEKIRTKAKALERMVAVATALGPLQEVAALHADAPQEAALVANILAASQVASHIRIVIAEAGTVITTHAGPKAVGLACVLAQA